MFDLIIANGTVIDGTGAPRRPADVGLRGDRITAVGDLRAATAARRLDATGHIVAPGFIDVHTHSDAWLLAEPHFLAKTSQGFTTEFVMLDGLGYAPVNEFTAPEWLRYLRPLNGLDPAAYTGWRTIAEFMALYDGRCAQNTATFIPYANLRTLAAGFGRAAPDDYQMRDIQHEVEVGLAAGAVGLSTGLDYIDQCFATTAELIDACRPLAASGALYTTHVRYKRGVLAGVQEAVAIGRAAGVPVHISHLKGYNTAEIEAVLAYIDATAVHEVDFSFDVYPYVPTSTMLQYLLPYSVWHNGPLAAVDQLRSPRLRATWDRHLATLDLNTIFLAWLPGADQQAFLGRSLADYIAAAGGAPADALCDLLIANDLAVLLVFRHGDDALVHPFLAHPRYMMGSDGIYFPGGVVHPRQYGSAPRLLGSCVRDHQLFTLEAAVYKLTGFPADRHHLAGRGRIAVDCFADLVIFDPDTIADRATYGNPHQTARGVRDVLVNGVPIVTASQPVNPAPDPWPGRYLRFTR